MTDCAQELCLNWSGDGRVCPCAQLEIEGVDRPIMPEEAR